MTRSAASRIAGRLPAPAPKQAYDPGDHTVAEVLAYLEAHPDQAEAVLEAEAAGKARTTLLAHS
jgi:hypothetical protein